MGFVTGAMKNGERHKPPVTHSNSNQKQDIFPIMKDTFVTNIIYIRTMPNTQTYTRMQIQLAAKSL